MTTIKTEFDFHGLSVEIEGMLVVVKKAVAGKPKLLDIEDIRIVGNVVIYNPKELIEAALKEAIGEHLNQ